MTEGSEGFRPTPGSDVAAVLENMSKTLGEMDTHIGRLEAAQDEISESLRRLKASHEAILDVLKVNKTISGEEYLIAYANCIEEGLQDVSKREKALVEKLREAGITIKSKSHNGETTISQEIQPQSVAVVAIK